MGKILSLTLSTIIAIAALSSCGSSECFDNQSTLPLAGFYSMQTRTAITVDSLTVYGIGAPGDSILVDNGKELLTIADGQNYGQATKLMF